MSSNFQLDSKRAISLVSALLASNLLLTAVSSNAAGTVNSLTKPPVEKKSATSKSADKKQKATSTAKTDTTTTSASTGSANATAADTAAVAGDVLRLTKEVMPISYDLTFTPDLEKFTYTGKEIVEIDVASPRKEIVMNALEMDISDVEITNADGTKKLSATVKMDLTNEQVKFEFPESLAAGKYKLQMKFSAILNDSLRGFYRSYYKDSTGEKHWLCSSQMEPADARRMFPCFDEPEFKATFQISAVLDKKLNAISNAPLDHITDINEAGKKVFAFAPTPKMSTYLMVLVVGEFSSTEERKSCNVPIRVWAPTGQEKMGNYALGAACDIMVFLQDYFGIKFPAKKLDLIAIPDFAPGAMENLGAITFKDSLLLIDEKTGSNFAKRSALSVIAHEMAHQWFGDLVTNRWWDDLWLNEAFATWAATKTENALRPEWRVRTKELQDKNDAMMIDELSTTRAIHAHVGNPKQASEMFDAITYDKGSAVLRMLEVFVSEKNFQKGVHDYLEAHKFSNATSEDLWKSIGAASQGVPVPAMMDSWIMQAGFPLVSDVSKKANEKSLSLSQEKFLVMPGSKPDATKWMVPVMARTVADGPEKASRLTPLLLDKKQADFTVPTAGEKNSITFLNAGASGFYRVLYKPEALKELLSKFDSLTPDERLTLIRDVSILSRKGLVPVEQNFDIMLNTKNESDTVVLSSLITKFSGLKSYMDDATRPKYEKFVCANLLPLKKKYGWEEKKGEEDTIKDLRADLIKILGTAGQDAGTIKEAKDLFEKYLKNKESVSPDIVSTVLGIVAYNGNEAEYEQLKNGIKTASNPQEEKRFLLALTEFRQPALVAKTLDLTLAPETRATDSVSLLTSLLANKDVNVQAWKFTEANWDKLSKKFPPRFNKRIASNCSNFNTPEMERALTEYFSAHPMEMAKAAVSRALEEVHLSVLYKERNLDKIRNWILKQAD